MNKWFTGIILTVIVFISLASCSSRGGNAPEIDNDNHIPVNSQDTTFPVLEITNPVSNQVFNSGNSIIVTGRITDSDGLYRGSVRITNDANGNVLKEQLYEIHGVLDYSFNVSYIASVTATSDYTVSVWFEDHGLNKTTKTVKIKVTP